MWGRVKKTWIHLPSILVGAIDDFHVAKGAAMDVSNVAASNEDLMDYTGSE